MKQTQYQILYNQFKSMTDEQLNDIIADNGYEEVAKKVARVFSVVIEKNIYSGKRK